MRTSGDLAVRALDISGVTLSHGVTCGHVKKSCSEPEKHHGEYSTEKLPEPGEQGMVYILRASPERPRKTWVIWQSAHRGIALLVGIN